MEWNNPGTDRTGDYRVVLETAGMIALDNRRGKQQVLAYPDGGRQLFQVGRWMAECVRQGKQVALLLRCPPDALEELELSFQQGAADLRAAAWGETRTFSQVKLLRFVPHRSIQIVEAGPAPRTAPKPAPEPAPKAPPARPAPALKPAPEPAPEAEELKKLREELERAKAQWKAEQDRAAALEKRLAAQGEQDLDARLAALSAQLPELTEGLEAKREELRGLQAAQRKLEGQIQEAQEQAERLRDQAAELRALREVREDECRQCREELEELKLALKLDGETAQLLQAEGALSAPSLERGMEEARQAVERAEAALARTVRLRDFFRKNVRQTIFSGDGTLSQDQEREEEQNGGPGGSAQSNP